MPMFWSFGVKYDFQFLLPVLFEEEHFNFVYSASLLRAQQYSVQPVLDRKEFISLISKVKIYFSAYMWCSLKLLIFFHIVILIKIVRMFFFKWMILIEKSFRSKFLRFKYNHSFLKPMWKLPLMTVNRSNRMRRSKVIEFIAARLFFFKAYNGHSFLF